jgi:hypothetical protein
LRWLCGNISKIKGESVRCLCPPVDVQLDKDNKTIVQPDVLILCDQSKNTGRCIYGVSDMVIEVIRGIENI